MAVVARPDALTEMRRNSLAPAQLGENEPLLSNVLPTPPGQHDESETSPEVKVYWKLSATMFDFFASGMAMAAIGVGICDCCDESILTVSGLDSRCELS